MKRAHDEEEKEARRTKPLLDDARAELAEAARARSDRLGAFAFRRLFGTETSEYGQLLAVDNWHTMSVEALALTARACFPAARTDEEAVQRAAAVLCVAPSCESSAAGERRARLTEGHSSGPMLRALYTLHLAEALADRLDWESRGADEDASDDSRTAAKDLRANVIDGGLGGLVRVILWQLKMREYDAGEVEEAAQMLISIEEFS